MMSPSQLYLEAMIQPNQRDRWKTAAKWGAGIVGGAALAGIAGVGAKFAHNVSYLTPEERKEMYHAAKTGGDITDYRSKIAIRQINEKNRRENPPKPHETITVREAPINNNQVKT